MQLPPIDAPLIAARDFRITTNFVLRAPAPEGPYLVNLEGDGTTGYFYAIDNSRGQPFQDGCLIWTPDSAEDKPYVANIYWTADSTKALLTINDFPNAIFDFERKVGCCRSGYPQQIGQLWSPAGRDWQDVMLYPFLPPTPWVELSKEIEQICSIDARIENHHEILIVDTSPTAFLGNPARVEELFSLIKDKAPENSIHGFYSAGDRLIIMASSNNEIQQAVAQDRGYVSQAF